MIPERLLTAFERIALALERQASCQEHAQRLVDSASKLQEQLVSEMARLEEDSK